jgi:lipopolysaccharide cholinephosphotransferase
MNELQHRILNMMVSVHELCKKYNITYYIIGGTMLGAIRHHGFIPWDDDIDIAMPRPDYKRFLMLTTESLPDWMELRMPGDEKFLNYGYAKIVDRNTTLIEDTCNKEISGVFIDLFPLDGLGNNKEKAFRRLKIARIKDYLLRSKQNIGVHKSVPQKILWAISKFSSVKSLDNNLEKYLTRFNYYDSDFVANAVGRWALKEFIKKDWLGKPTLYNFESVKLFGVENSDKYLKQLYGDYMKLPPKNKQYGEHVAFLDLTLPYRNYNGIYKS